MTKQELDRLGLIELAVLCQKAADEPSMPLELSEKALQLKHEWARLVIRETPPPRSYKEKDQIQKEKAGLKIRIVEFLAHL